MVGKNIIFQRGLDKGRKQQKPWSAKGTNGGKKGWGGKKERLPLVQGRKPCNQIRHTDKTGEKRRNGKKADPDCNVL